MIRYDSIDVWPGRLRSADERKWSPFDASWSSTVELLERERWMLNADEVVIRLAVPPSAIRRDGGLVDGRKPPEHPGVIVVIDSPDQGVLTYATDRFYRRDTVEAWRANVRAVALGLEALRKIERYGIAERGEQYAGWKQLGSGIAMGMAAAELTIDEAATLLAGAVRGTTADAVMSNRVVAASCYRAAMRLLHPDSGGPDDEITREKLARLHDAWRIVDDWHKGAA